jgi:regulator of replication initiation timing
MTLAEMNVLLEEGAQSSSALAAFASAGVTAAGELVEHAQALGLKAIDEAKRLHHEYSEAIEAIKHAAEEAGGASEAAAQSVESVSTESAKAGTAFKDMLVAVEGDAYHFGEARARVFHALDASAREAEGGFHELAARVEAFEEHIADRIKDATEMLKHVQETVMEVATQLVEAQQHLHEQIEQAATSGAATFSQVTHALDQTLSAVAERLVSFANDGIIGHNTVVGAARQLYLEETKDDPVPEHTYVGTSFEGVRGALEAFQQLPDAAEATLQMPMPAILNAGEGAVTALSDAVRAMQQSTEMVTR